MENNKEKKYRLPKDFADEWLEALRSGKYNQADGVLYDSKYNEYCCLGVACRIKYPLHYLKNCEGGYASLISVGLDPYNVRYNLKKIPNELKGDCLDNDLVNKLTSMNDNGKTFSEIANWIEDNVELYS